MFCGQNSSGTPSHNLEWRRVETSHHVAQPTGKLAGNCGTSGYEKNIAWHQQACGFTLSSLQHDLADTEPFRSITTAVTLNLKQEGKHVGSSN
jgi:hypothetical protein